MFANVAAGARTRPGWQKSRKASSAGSSSRSPSAATCRARVQLDAELHRHFREHQIFRIDHYLAKETVQNILALRFTNTIFEPIWNRRYVDHVQITVAEELGVEHRGDVLRAVGRTARHRPEPPPPGARAHGDGAAGVVRRQRDPRREGEGAPVGPSAPACRAARHVVRGQYTRGEIDGVEVPGYREEEGVSPDSNVETYLAIEFDVDNWRWAGVPFYVRTGKRLPHRVTEVALRYKPVPFLPLPPTAVAFRRAEHDGAPHPARRRDHARVRGQGPGHRRSACEASTLDFRYRQAFAEKAPEAYERVLGDAFLGDATLFIRADEVDQAWRIVQPLIDAFDAGTVPLSFYPAGTLGPARGRRRCLAQSYGDTWRTP